MFIDMEDPALLAEIARLEKEEEDAWQIRHPQVRDTVELTAVPIPGFQYREVTGDDVALALIDNRCVYTIKGPIINVTMRPNTSTEQKIDIPLEVAERYYSEGRHVGGHAQDISPLPPSRRDPSVSGQMKLAVDVALMLPNVKKTDKVVIIGSASVDGVSGRSYYMLAGAVKEVHMYDPGEPGTTQEVCEGTVFHHYRKEWPQPVPIQADVVFTDAFDKGTEEAIVFNVAARAYSMKDAGINCEARILAKYPDAHLYAQLSNTGEYRWTMPERNCHVYTRRYGTCAACRELDYRGQDYAMSEYQYNIWVEQHAYGGQACSIALHVRNPLQKYASMLMWRTATTPISLEPYDGHSLVIMCDISDPPRIDVEKHGLEYYGKYYSYKCRETRDTDPEVRPVGMRPPMNQLIPTNAVYFKCIEGTYSYPAAPKQSNWAMLVVDTFVYMVGFLPGDETIGRRQRASLIDYTYGPIVSSKPIGPWRAYRHHILIASGKTGGLLSMRVLRTRKTQHYDTLGAGYLGTAT